MDIINIASLNFFQKAFEHIEISEEAFALLVGKTPARISHYLTGREPIPNDVFSFAMDMLSAHSVDPMTFFPFSDEDDFYYHATSAQIAFPLDVNRNKKSFNDFGNGIYLTDSFRQALTLRMPRQRTFVYCFRKSSFRRAKILDLSSLLKWFYFIGLNRGKIYEDSYDRLRVQLLRDVERSDVVKGKIADGFSYRVTELLFANKLDVDQAEACAAIMSIGNQYCIKSDTLARALQPDRLIALDKTLTRYFDYYGWNLQRNFDELLQKTLEAPPSENHLFSKVIEAKYGSR